MKVDMDKLATETFAFNSCIISNWPLHDYTTQWNPPFTTITTGTVYIPPQDVRVKLAQNGYIIEFNNQSYIAKDEQELCKLIKSFKEVK